ncbi:hypothetical protein DID77_02575 [Candidatus Marinamargulisbacteria bacterium SCGC AG-439-L15]|nr:hypothetical protein DID77_02575 [Candidatus Marinamargulisbacteria bacterium SCGC AG-439-L15]
MITTTKQNITRCKPYLGTYVEVSVTGEKSAADLIQTSESIFNEIKKIDTMMNAHNPNSELSFINQNAFKTNCRLSKDIYIVIKKALELSQLTNGNFDITLPKLPTLKNTNKVANWQDICLKKTTIQFRKKLTIDLGGIAKGYAVDKAMEIIKDPSIEVCINAGGDIRMTHWKQKIAHIKVGCSEKKHLIPIKMKNTSIATSSHYYTENTPSSIIHPHTKKPDKNPHTISIFAPNCMLADALTKVIWLNPKDHSLLPLFDATAIIHDKKGIDITKENLK